MPQRTQLYSLAKSFPVPTTVSLPQLVQNDTLLDEFLFTLPRRPSFRQAVALTLESRGC